MKKHNQSTILKGLAIVFLTIVFSTQHARSQGHISISAGPDFATFQILKDGKTSPLYSDENLKVGIAVPFSITGNYTFSEFYSTAVDQVEPIQINLFLTAAAGGYASYEFSETFRISAILGFGALINSQPYSVSIGENGDLTNEFTDFFNTGIYVDLQGRYEKFGLKFTTMQDLFQVFATYHVTEKFFAGIGARQLNRILLMKDNSSPKNPTVLQATLGLTLGK